MSTPSTMILADAVLALHVGNILFNVFGLIVIPLGGWRGWKFVRVAWWLSETGSEVGVGRSSPRRTFGTDNETLMVRRSGDGDDRQENGDCCGDEAGFGECIKWQ